jgi:hypothetical protein
VAMLVGGIEWRREILRDGREAVFPLARLR